MPVQLPVIFPELLAKDPPRVWGLGLDLGIKKGAMSIVFRHPQYYMAYPLKAWDDGPDAKQDPMKIAQWFEGAVINTLSGISMPGIPIAIDWDSTDAFWGNRMVASRKAYIMGYLTRAFLGFGLVPMYVKPRVVRKFISLSPKTEKEETVKAYVRKYHVHFDPDTRAVIPPKLIEDVKDAAILALLSILIPEENRAKEPSEERT